MTRRYGLGRYLAGAVAARAGDEMSGPALMLAGFALTGSAASASALLAGLTVAAAAGGPVLGALLDRRERPGRLLAAALAAYAAGLTALLAGLARLPFAICVALAVLTGLAGPALSGGWTAQLPRVAAASRLPRASALDALTFTLAGLTGPALAGATAEAANAPAAVAVSAALIAAAIPAAWTLPPRTPRSAPAPLTRAPGPPQIRAGSAPHVRRSPEAVRGGQASAAGVRPGSPPAPPDAPPGRTPGSRRPGPPPDVRAGSPPHPPDDPAPDAPPGRAPGLAAEPSTGGRARPPAGAPPSPAAGSVWRELGDGVRLMVRRPRLGRATVTSVGCSAAQGMLAACLPLLGAREFGGAGRGMLLLSGAALSSLAAGGVLARFPRAAPPDTVVWVAALVQAAALALAAGCRPGLLVAALLLAGAGEGPQLTALFAVRHREAPDALRARVFTTGASLKITGYALGAAAAGPVAARSVPAALAAAAGVAALSAAAYRGGRSRTGGADPARAAKRPRARRRAGGTGRTTPGRRATRARRCTRRAAR
ncbi:MFS transporter [Streptomyces sp. NRRL F-5123]|uniref:MFS transporter n=1 Tax=Streptomyces sp. NRRL F-5123 TaxID=1463856 RepID=UPI0007C55D65|nr:MFS transporter [Streptomyces sp. NRRL F-5123]